MIDTLNCDTFIDRFMAIRPDNFTREGLIALFDWYEEYESATDKPIEFDPVAICCDWAQYENEKEALEAYGLEDIEKLEEKTSVLLLDSGSLVVANF